MVEGASQDGNRMDCICTIELGTIVYDTRGVMSERIHDANARNGKDEPGNHCDK